MEAGELTRLFVFLWQLLRSLLPRPGAAENGPTLVSFSGSVTAQHGTLRPGKLGFHFVELAGVIDVLRFGGEQGRNFVLHFADTFLRSEERRVGKECGSW